MRLFIAFPLTSEVLNKISPLEEEINKKFGFKLNWIPLGNLHLTILFLGYLNQDNYLKIEEIFSNYHGPQDTPHLKIKKIDYGAPGAKRMIWLYLERSQILEEIRRYFEIEIKRKKINYRKEERKFLAHINLIRLKNFRNLPEIKKELNWRIRMNEICLFQSILTADGAIYKKLKSIFLKEGI